MEPAAKWECPSFIPRREEKRVFRLPCPDIYKIISSLFLSLIIYPFTTNFLRNITHRYSGWALGIIIVPINEFSCQICDPNSCVSYDCQVKTGYRILWTLYLASLIYVLTNSILLIQDKLLTIPINPSRVSRETYR